MFLFDVNPQVYTDRINEVNSTLHMVEEINPDALGIAAELDAEREAGNSRGLVPLEVIVCMGLTIA